MLGLVSYFSHAQEQRISMLQGSNSAYIRGNPPFDESYRRGAAYHAGIQYNVKVKRFHIGAGISYIPRGFIVLALTSSASSEYVYYNNDYIGFPLSVSYRTRKRFFGMFGTGLTPSVLIRHRVFFQGELLAPNPNGGPSKLDLGGQIDIGCGYRITEKWAILANIGFFHSFTKVNNDNYFRSTDFRNTGASIVLGIEYKFKGE